MLSELQSIGRVVTPIALDIYDRSTALALLPQIARFVPNPQKAKSHTFEWITVYPELKKWMGDRVVQKSFQEALTITGEPYEMTDAFDKYDIERGTALATVQDKTAAIASGFALGKLMIAWRPLRHNLLAYDGQSFFDTDHVKPDGRTYSNVVHSVRADPTTPSIQEARDELTEALVRLVENRLWNDSLISADDVNRSLIVIVRSNKVFKPYNRLRTEPSFGADANVWKGAFSLWLDPNPEPGTENRVDAILSLPDNGPRPVLFMATREPAGIEFDYGDAFATRTVSFGMDGEYGVLPGFPQTAVRINPDSE
jgi:Mu-like prophage major head subunit gpT